jgi:hypothetical protein
MIDISAHGMELEVKEPLKIVVRIIFIGLLRLRLKLREMECFEWKPPPARCICFSC